MKVPKMSSMLYLEFRNAGLPQKGRDLPDIIEFNGNRSPRSEKYLDVPVGTLHANHIANVLRVLKGKRPVPSMRKHFFSESGDELQKAKSAYVSMGDMFINKKKDGEPVYAVESMTTRKSVDNSYNTGAKTLYSVDGEDRFLETRLSWHIVSRILGSKMSGFIRVINDSQGPATTLSPISDLIGKLQSNPCPKISEYISKCDVPMSLRQVFCGQAGLANANAIRQGSGFGNKKHMHILMVPNSVEKFSRLSGTIAIPVSDEDLEDIKNGPGTATLLDGGFVFIREVDESLPTEQAMLASGYVKAFSGESK